MRIKNLKVRNFTSLADVDLTDLPELIVFIGKNSSGKSNLIDALALFFDNFGSALEEALEDPNTYQHLFFNHDTQVSPPPEIAVTLSLLLEEWCGLLGVSEIPNEDFEQMELCLVKQIIATDSNVLWRTCKVEVEGFEVVTDGRIAQDNVPIAIEAAGDLPLDPVVVPVDQFLSRLGEFLQSGFQVIHTTESPRSWPDRFMERPTIMDTKQIQNLWQSSQSKGNQRQDWTRVAREYEGIAPNEQRPVAVASSIQMEEDTLSIPVGMTGEGSQAMLRLIDQLDRGPQILAIEEPETHLHPALIKKAGQLLTKATENGKQLFICTHSPFLIDRSSLDNFFIVKNEGNGTQVTPMRNTGNLRGLLLDIGVRPSDILFWDAILLVEGLSDDMFINGLSRKIGAPLANCQVKVIPSNGKSRGKYKIEFWAEVGRDADIPLYLILDKNAQPEAESAITDGHIPRERCLILDRGDLEDYYPWPVLENALRTEFEIEVEQPIPVGSRVQELRKLVGGKAKGNSWKPRLAEEALRTLTSEDAESELAEMVSFLRKIDADVGVD